MRCIKPKLSISKLSIFGCRVFTRKRDRGVRKLEAKALERKFVGYTEGDNGYLVYPAHPTHGVRTQGYGSSRCDHQGVRSGLNTWQHKDARPTSWGVTATVDLAPRWWSSRQFQQRGTGQIYCNKRGVAWRREREHSWNDNEMRCLRYWGSSTGWRLYCNKRESQRLWVTGRQWNGGLLTVRDSWFLWGVTGASGKGRAQTKDTGKECSAIFGEVRTHLGVTEGDYVEPKTVYEANHGDDLDQFDVKMAFLHSSIEEEVYLEQPEEFVKKRSDGEKLVCRLNRPIYGLKQAANNCYKELANFLLKQGFASTRSRNDIACSQKQRQRFTPSSWSGLTS